MSADVVDRRYAVARAQLLRWAAPQSATQPPGEGNEPAADAQKPGEDDEGPDGARPDDDDDEGGAAIGHSLPAGEVKLEVLCAQGWYRCAGLLRWYLTRKGAVSVTPEAAEQRRVRACNEVPFDHRRNRASWARCGCHSSTGGCARR